MNRVYRDHFNNVNYDLSNGHSFTHEQAVSAGWNPVSNAGATLATTPGPPTQAMIDAYRASLVPATQQQTPTPTPSTTGFQWPLGTVRVFGKDVPVLLIIALALGGWYAVSD